MLDKTGRILSNKILPLGLFLLITGMLWLGRHGEYARLFYLPVGLPALLLIAIQPKSIRHMLSSRIVIAYLLFACYMSTTLFWSVPNGNALDLIKRPLFIFLFFYAVFEFGRRRFDLLLQTVGLAALCGSGAALWTVGRFIAEGANGRLAGYGALYNPLLVSHVFGFFMALWLGIYFTKTKLLEPLTLFSILICGILLFATGSRTPLVALVVTLVWLAVLTANRKAALAFGALVLLSATVIIFAPELITQRGFSYRNEIWANVLRQIAEKAWIGHGYGTPLRVQLDAFPFPFSDPHNLTLSVFYEGGVFGLLLWLWMYCVALKQSWRFRGDKWVLVSSAAVVYGLSAGMTEGGSFLSRPNEHWFLIWIPLALLAAAIYRGRADGEAKWKIIY